jgi:hypothetical protein
MVHQVLAVSIAAVTFPLQTVVAPVMAVAYVADATVDAVVCFIRITVGAVAGEERLFTKKPIVVIVPVVPISAAV